LELRTDLTPSKNSFRRIGRDAFLTRHTLGRLPIGVPSANQLSRLEIVRVPLTQPLPQRGRGERRRATPPARTASS
jgi:hypothetical protein